MPYRMPEYYLREMYLSNHLVKPDVTGRRRFVLSSSDHILSIVNPPVSSPKRRYQVGRAHRGQSADACAWLAERCGEPRTPRFLFSDDYPKLADAPGTHVLER